MNSNTKHVLVHNKLSVSGTDSVLHRWHFVGSGNKSLPAQEHGLFGTLVELNIK